MKYQKTFWIIVIIAGCLFIASVEGGFAITASLIAMMIALWIVSELNVAPPGPTINIISFVLIFFLCLHFFGDSFRMLFDDGDIGFIMTNVIFSSFAVISICIFIILIKQYSNFSLLRKQRKQFDYKIIHTEDVYSGETEDKLNTAGDNGWEICNVSSKQGLILKRRKSLIRKFPQS